MKTTFAFSFLVFVFFTLSFSSIGCKNEMKIVTHTVIDGDPIIITDSINIDNFMGPDGTKFILIRHAETEATGSNPSLNAIGIERANDLIKILKNINLDAIYSTNFVRTLSTVSPMADDHGLTTQFYNTNDLDGFVDTILQDESKEIVFVVGHSNTTPDLINLLTGSMDYAQFSEEVNDDFFIVTTFSKGDAQVLHFKY